MVSSATRCMPAGCCGRWRKILLLQNGLAGPLDLAFFILFYFLRVQTEEKMMLAAFGRQYCEHIKRTGGVIPKLEWLY